MAQITYQQIPSLSGGTKVRNHLGAVSHFGDSLAWSAFLEGAARQRSWGVEITVVDIDGKVLVGTVEQLDPAS